MNVAKWRRAIVVFGSFSWWLCLSSAACAFTHAVQVTVDGDSTPFVLDAGGSVWGFLRPDYFLDPVKLLKLTNIVQIVPFAALTSDGHVFTWDYSSHKPCYFSQGEIDRTVTYTVPSEVFGLDKVVFIAGNTRHFLALRRDGSVVEFGRKLNLGGDFQDRCAALLTEEKMPRPKIISSVKAAKTIAVNARTSAVLDQDGFFYSWGKVIPGRNWHQDLKIQLPADNPRKIFIGTDKISIGINDEYLIALSDNGKAYYWGSCEYGMPGWTNLLTGSTDGITGIKKVILPDNPGSLHVDVLSAGGVIMLYPPDRSNFVGSCSSDQDIHGTYAESVPDVPVKIIDAAFPIGQGTTGNALVMVGTDGSLWMTTPNYTGGFSHVENVSIP
jgi:alpha-tubulin suppressor-like RCC1 family protein